MKPACPRDDQITPGFTIPDDEDLSKPLELKSIPPHQVTVIQSDISDHTLDGVTMNSDCNQSNAHNAADTHIIDTSLSKSHSISRILAKKHDLEGTWYYRVSYVKLPKSFNKCICQDDLPEDFNQLVHIEGNKIKTRHRSKI